MKWIIRGAAALAIAAAALAALFVGTARTSERPVGFQVARVESPSGPVAVALWYPTAATPWPTTFVGGQLLDVARDAPVAGRDRPVVLISHGNGGSALSHVDLAMALAGAGFVVAAPTHAGDNHADASRQGAAALYSQRTGQMRAVLDHVLARWAGAPHVDATRVGAFGFSAGGHTVLSLVGGTPDMARIATHCARTPEFVCTALRQAGSPLLAGADGAGVFAADPRIRAAAVAAPGLGFTFAGRGLSGVRVPVQLWSVGQDATVPFATNTRVVRDGLGARAELHAVPGATHVAFLAPCGLLRPPAVCADAPGFDRTAMHASMNADVVRFFNRQLAVAPRYEGGASPAARLHAAAGHARLHTVLPVR